MTLNDHNLYEKIRSLRHHGDDGRHHAYNHVRIGINSRLDEIQAAVLNVKLGFLLKWNKQRQSHADYYDRHIKKLRNPDLVLLQITSASKPVYHQYVLRIKHGKRDQVLSHLRSDGIQAAVYYPTPLHFQPCFRFLGHRKGDFPVSEQAAQEVLSLPLFPQIKKSQQARILSSLSSL